ncbi:MAG: DUF2461 domain-containing protein [Clostridiales bacterium]|nr:DUF2461 domain-containing protein [Clostridiales bacterium]
MEYSGIKPEALMLMEENRFRDSKPFYEENKEKIKQGMTVPMREIAAILGGKMARIDPLMVTDPVKMVSRIRRDTRFSKDKHLYRDNMWVMFMRDKREWQHYPCLWFEVTPKVITSGICFFDSNAALMNTFRQKLIEKPSAFKNAFKRVESTGSLGFGDCYKKQFKDCPKGLEKYFSLKNVGFMASFTDFTVLTDNRIIEILDRLFDDFTPLFRLMLEVSDCCFAKGE